MYVQEFYDLWTISEHFLPLFQVWCIIREYKIKLYKRIKWCLSGSVILTYICGINNTAPCKSISKTGNAQYIP